MGTSKPSAPPFIWQKFKSHPPERNEFSPPITKEITYEKSFCVRVRRVLLCSRTCG